MSAPPRRGRLYLIPTPIGDATPAADVLPARTLAAAARLDYFVVESAKRARAFLRQLPLEHPLQSIELVEHNEHTRDRDPATLLAPLLAGRDGGLLSDAGCPGVADPGADVVAAAHAHDVPVVPLVGPSALLLALMASGLNGQQFAFVGYLPVDRAERASTALAHERRSRQTGETVLLIETPYRNQAMLETLVSTLAPDTSLAVALDVGQPGEWLHMQRIAAWRATPVALPKAPAVFALRAAPPREAARARPALSAAAGRPARRS